MADSLRTDYDRIAGLYDIDRAQWVIRPDKVVAALLAERRTNIRVLDVGCGTGLYLCAQREHFDRAPVRWFGVDASTQMLSRAIEKAPDMRLARARAEALPVDTGTIDYVYSSFAFHHFADKLAALDEIARVLGNDGHLRIRNMDPWGQKRWWLYDNFAGAWETDKERFWPADRIQAALEQRGFDVQAEVEVEEATRTVGDALAEAERRVISQLAILDDRSYEAGIARLRALEPQEVLSYPRAGLTLDASRR